jgi:phospholipase C
MSLVASRRQVLKAGAAFGASLALGDLSIIRRAAAASSLPPTGVGAPFDHVVICMMENRSFDHFLGWMATRRTTLPPTTRAVATPTPTTAGRAGRSNSTADGWMAS